MEKKFGSGNLAKYLCVEFKIEDKYVCDLIMTDFEVNIKMLINSLSIEDCAHFGCLARRTFSAL